jgi:uncharacterized FlgJ-related protein
MALLMILTCRSNGQTAFFNKWKALAQKESQQYKIPYKVILAQAYVLSNGGRSTLATKYNNYFQVPCGEFRYGCVVDGNRIYSKSPTIEASFRMHSITITSGTFVDMRSICKDSEAKWFRYLASRRYSEIPDYEQKLKEACKRIP